MNQNLKHSMIWLIIGLIGITLIISLNSCTARRYSYITTVEGIRTHYADFQTINEVFDMLQPMQSYDYPYIEGFYDFDTQTIWCQEWDKATWYHEYRYHKGECHDYWAKEWYPCNYSKLYNPPIFEKNEDYIFKKNEDYIYQYNRRKEESK